MHEVDIRKINKPVKVFFTNRKISLPNLVQKEIDNHWNSLIESGKKFKRGEVFTISDVEENKNEIVVRVALTDYAHYLHSIYSKERNEHSCRVIHTSALVETVDGMIIIGEMGLHTSMPRNLQCSGGGIDKDDIIGEYIDLDSNIKKELQEELGINVSDRKIVQDIRPAYLKSGGPRNSLAMIYHVNLVLDEMEFNELYVDHIKRIADSGELPEFNSIFIISKSRETLDILINDERTKDEYLIPLLREILE